MEVHLVPMKVLKMDPGIGKYLAPHLEMWMNSHLVQDIKKSLEIQLRGNNPYSQDLLRSKLVHSN